MSYMIHYGPSGNIEAAWQKKLMKHRAKTMTAIIAAVCCILLVLTVDIQQLKELLIPGDPAVTKEAFVQFTEDVRQGESVTDAITAFCREIIEYGLAAQ